MMRSVKATLFAVLCLGALPAPAAWGRSDPPAVGGTPAGREPDPAPANEPGRLSADLRAGPGALLGRSQRVSGRMARAGSGQTVRLALGDAAGGWETVAETRTGADGSFGATWRATRSGRFTLRAVLERRGRAGASAASALTAPVTVYEPGVATMFGPGLYGRRTACGALLAPTTVGVAHRTLACGTRVELYFAGRRLVAPVVDRGPFVAGVAWDLTAGAARSLAFDGRGVVGSMTTGRGPVPRR